MIKKYFSCAVSGRSNTCFMSLQDIPITNLNRKARVMFDNGFEISLVSNIFTRKANLPYEEASYTFAGIGSNSTTYNSRKIFTVPLIDSSGNKILIKAFRVDSILSDRIGREEVIFDKEDLPNLPKSVLVEAAKALPKRFLDILIGNPNLGLQPA